MKILLAVDGSVYSDAAVEELAKRPWPPQTEVKVINAVPVPIPIGVGPWGVSPDYFEKVEKSLRIAAKTVIEKAVGTLKSITGDTLKVTSEIIQGLPGQVIVEEGENWGADLIVMGSRGLGAWNRLVLGSVSNTVVHHAKCSVEIVRRPEGKEPHD
jgi:nucleotide-binding universal stress UspA family protein